MKGNNTLIKTFIKVSNMVMRRHHGSLKFALNIFFSIAEKSCKTVTLLFEGFRVTFKYPIYESYAAVKLQSNFFVCLTSNASDVRRRRKKPPLLVKMKTTHFQPFCGNSANCE